MPPLANAIPDEVILDDLLSEPSEELIAMMKGLEGDLGILGVAGKMGVTLALMARRSISKADPSKRVIGVARFNDARAKAQLEEGGVETIVCDLLDREAVMRLPDIRNVIFMAGRKFGAEGDLELTWAMNTLMPAMVAEKYSHSRIVAFSTGCVYPFVSAASGGCTEEEPPAPVGEYAQSCLGRERAFGYASLARGTPVCLLRLNYAIDLRYGVLHDIARKIWSGAPIELTMGWFNAIWQGDANNDALRALDFCNSPAEVLNITGPEIISVREAAAALGRIMDRDPILIGEEPETAYLNNPAKAAALFGPPRVPLERMIEWTAHWVMADRRSLNKPTHFEVRDGKY
jgi:nucleoside-diphosphate-sugar epimerase